MLLIQEKERDQMTGGTHCHISKNHFEMVNGVFCLVLKVKMCMLSGTKVQRVSNSTSSGDTLTFYSLKFVGCVYRNMQRS